MENQEICINLFLIEFSGDPSVGLSPYHFLLSGDFIFQDASDVDAFKEKIKEAFQYCEDDKPRIMSNLDYEAMEQHFDDTQQQSELERGRFNF